MKNLFFSFWIWGFWSMTSWLGEVLRFLMTSSAIQWADSMA